MQNLTIKYLIRVEVSEQTIKWLLYITNQRNKKEFGHRGNISIKSEDFRSKVKSLIEKEEFWSKEE